MMGNIMAIFGKEMRSYFGSPIAYVMAGVFLLFSGLCLSQPVARISRYDRISKIGRARRKSSTQRQYRSRHAIL